MREPVVRGVGAVVVLCYAAFIGWLFAAQPRTIDEVVGGVSAGLGTYAIDERAFAEGLTYFRRDQFPEARAAFARADPALRDPKTQFYIAYAYYRDGWRRTHSDDVLFKQGIDTVNRAIALSPSGRLVVEDDNLVIKSADELKAELQAGLTQDLSDFNPLRLLGTRK